MKNHRREAFKSLYKRTVGAAIMAVLVLLSIYMWYGKFNLLMETRFSGKGNILMVAMYAIEQFALVYALGGFKIGYNKGLNVVLSQIFAVIIGDLLLWGQIVLTIGNVFHLKEIGTGILWLGLMHIASCIILTTFFIALYGRLFPPYRMLMIHGEHSNELRKKVNSRRDKYRICEEISINLGLKEIQRKMSNYDAVLLNDIPSTEKNRILKYCFDHSIRVYFTPKLSDIIVKGTDEVDLFDSPLFLCKNFGLNFEQRFIKRLCDILFSAVGLVITSPILLITAIAIKLGDKGPVIYSQKRCSLNGKEFMVYKFRSMVVDAEKDGIVQLAKNNDSRITKVGGFIRRVRIDELPQLINVLKGDMSLVGPRPERPDFIEKFSKEIPEFSYRLKVKGGLTGYAQVFGKYNTSPYDKLKMDLMYIVNYSILLDIQIMILTLKVIFRKESTEGFQKKEERDWQ